ncbi:ribose 5-phosphate isomerase B [bacterium]|nr:ribose 5-phosphate isomerase B [bacterium]
MTLFIASDHGGFELKEDIKSFLMQQNIDFEDLGVNSSESVNYPDLAQKISRKVLENLSTNRGILLCGSGIGVSIAANRHKGIRAALVDSVTLAHLSREHNDANILCMGGRIIGKEVAFEIVTTFLNTEFQGGRHQKRVELIEEF